MNLLCMTFIGSCRLIATPHCDSSHQAVIVTNLPRSTSSPVSREAVYRGQVAPHEPQFLLPEEMVAPHFGQPLWDILFTTSFDLTTRRSTMLWL